MATQATLTIDTAPLKQALGEFSRKYGFDESEILKDQVRLLVQTLIKWTPPATQKAGRETVRRDVLKMAQFAYDEHSDLMGLKRDARRSKDGHVYRWWDGELKKIPVDAIDTDGSKIERDRPKFRDNRGRVRRGSNIVTSLRIVKRVSRGIFKHVGNVKRGWQKAAQALGAELPPFSLKSVSGPSGKASGGIKDQSEATFFDKSITIWNDTPYIRDDGFLRRAMEVRLKDIKNQLIKRMEKRAEEVSAT